MIISAYTYIESGGHIVYASCLLQRVGKYYFIVKTGCIPVRMLVCQVQVFKHALSNWMFMPNFISDLI